MLRRVLFFLSCSFFGGGGCKACCQECMRLINSDTLALAYVCELLGVVSIRDLPQPSFAQKQLCSLPPLADPSLLHSVVTRRAITSLVKCWFFNSAEGLASSHSKSPWCCFPVFSALLFSLPFQLYYDWGLVLKRLGAISDPKARVWVLGVQFTYALRIYRLISHHGIIWCLMMGNGNAILLLAALNFLWHGKVGFKFDKINKSNCNPDQQCVSLDGLGSVSGWPAGTWF